eukprot:gb/GECG01000655.1/.p1 GENE.gb/GECG01000655.1/~~gb/GECG01000655.1/.p1  ORF type:complete len:1121 (+),score=146.60 gb/GECG01000655.1/:1-3363(+)
MSTSTAFSSKCLAQNAASTTQTSRQLQKDQDISVSAAQIQSPRKKRANNDTEKQYAMVPLNADHSLDLVMQELVEKRHWWKLTEKAEPLLEIGLGDQSRSNRERFIKRHIIDDVIHFNRFNLLWSDTLHVNLGYGLKSLYDLLTEEHHYSKAIRRYQTINHFPNNKHLCSKSLLIQTINNGMKMTQREGSRSKHVFDVCPATFYFPGSLSKLSTDQARVWSEFSKRFHELSAGQCSTLRLPGKHCLSNLWIVKPVYGMDGGGLRIFGDIGELKRFLQAVESDWIVQKCIERPLLVNNRKISMRTWMLITDSFDVFVHRQPHFLISSEDYEMTGEHLSDGETGYNRFVRRVHFTSTGLQQESNSFGVEYLGNVLYLEDLRKHLEQDTEFSPESLERVLLPRVRKILADTVRGCMAHLRQGIKGRRCFEILSADFAVDEDLRPWLLDISENPCLDTPTETHEALVEGMMQQAISLTVDPLYPPQRHYKPGENIAQELESVHIHVEEKQSSSGNGIATGTNAVVSSGEGDHENTDVATELPYAFAEKLAKDQGQDWKVTPTQKTVFTKYYDLVFRVQDAPDIETSTQEPDTRFEEEPPARSRRIVPEWALQHGRRDGGRDTRFDSWWDPNDALDFEEHIVASYSPPHNGNAGVGQNNESYEQNASAKRDHKFGSESTHPPPPERSPPPPATPTRPPVTFQEASRKMGSKEGSKTKDTKKALGTRDKKADAPTGRKKEDDEGGVLGDITSIQGIIERSTALLGAAEQDNQYESNLSDDAIQKRRRLLRRLRTVINRLRYKHQGQVEEATATATKKDTVHKQTTLNSSIKKGKKQYTGGTRNLSVPHSSRDKKISTAQDAIKELATLLKQLAVLTPPRKTSEQKEQTSKPSARNEAGSVAPRERGSNDDSSAVSTNYVGSTIANPSAFSNSIQAYIQPNHHPWASPGGEYRRSSEASVESQRLERSLNSVKKLEQVWVEVPLGERRSAPSSYDRYYYNAYTRKSTWTLPQDDGVVVVPHHRLGDFVESLKARLTAGRSPMNSPYAKPSAQTVAREWSRMRSNIVGADMYFHSPSSAGSLAIHRGEADAYSEDYGYSSATSATRSDTDLGDESRTVSTEGGTSYSR